MVHVHTVQARRHVRAADGHQRFGLKFQLRPQQRAFQAGSAGRIADQLIGGAECILVQRTRRRDAQVVIAFTAEVLYRGGQTGFEYLDHASASCSDLG